MSEHPTLTSFFRVYNAYEVRKRPTANSSSQESHVRCQTDLAESPFILFPEMLALFLQLMLRFVNFSKCHLLYKQVHIKNVFRNNLKKQNKTVGSSFNMFLLNDIVKPAGTIFTVKFQFSTWFLIHLSKSYCLSFSSFIKEKVILLLPT